MTGFGRGWGGDPILNCLAILLELFGKVNKYVGKGDPVDLHILGLLKTF